MILSQGLKLFGIGAALGLTAALALSRGLVHLLYRVSPSDPASFAVVTAVPAGVTLLACCVPARRAMPMDPVAGLRNEGRVAEAAGGHAYGSSGVKKSHCMLS